MMSEVDITTIDYGERDVATGWIAAYKKYFHTYPDFFFLSSGLMRLEWPFRRLRA
jgi:hypothetical protein